MGRKLYVGGLPYSVTEGRLQEIFAAHGTVESAKVITDKLPLSHGVSGSWTWVPGERPKGPSRPLTALTWTGAPSWSMKPSRWKGVTVVEEIEETEAADVTAGSILVLE